MLTGRLDDLTNTVLMRHHFNACCC